MTPFWHDNDNGMSEADLQAYVDGQLGGRRRAEVEAYLAADPAEAARLAAYRDQNIALHALFDPGRGNEGELPPDMAVLGQQLQHRIDRSEARPPKARRSARRLAACVAVAVSAGTAGWLAMEQSVWRDDPLVALTRQASDASVQLASNKAGAPAVQGEDLKVATWLAALPGNTPQQLPDLEALGFGLTAQRVIRTASGQPAAQLLYQDESGQRVTLYMRAGGTADQITFTFTKVGEDAQFFWQDQHMGYSLVGKMPQDKLLRIAEAINQSLRQDAQPPSGDTAPKQPLAPPAEEATQVNDEALTTPKAEQGGEPAGEKTEPLPQPMLQEIDLPKET